MVRNDIFTLPTDRTGMPLMPGSIVISPDDYPGGWNEPAEDHNGFAIVFYSTMGQCCFEIIESRKGERSVYDYESFDNEFGVQDGVEVIGSLDTLPDLITVNDGKWKLYQNFFNARLKFADKQDTPEGGNA